MNTNNPNNTFSVDSAGDSTGFLLWQVTALWQRELRKALERFGITHSQFVLLASIHWLTLQKQQVTQIVLSNYTKIDPMTTSTILRTMQQKGLVARQEHSTDTRAKSVGLTKKGIETVKETVIIVEQFDALFFSPIKTISKEFNKNLLSLLKQTT